MENSRKLTHPGCGGVIIEYKKPVLRADFPGIIGPGSCPRPTDEFKIRYYCDKCGSKIDPIWVEKQP